jgi:hypothetical protein
MIVLTNKAATRPAIEPIHAPNRVFKELPLNLSSKRIIAKAIPMLSTSV